ncbi:response regulator [Roseiterribacter gracilis]|uniref:Response regulator n=1 Tax=Roseiterribacter gracilis TaxID=2812848 RepID=A0A8S8XEJ4_9PROT|nr:response regulator [Rhodospirillales bacterium TMPK1]
MNPVSIVLIEDDDGHATLIERNIRRAGVSNQIHRFADATSGLAHLDAQCAAHAGGCLLLLDLNLPDMSGIDVLRKVKSDPNHRATPVIVLTTTDDQTEIQKCYELGCNVYITKPVEYERFANAIRQLGLFLSIIQVPAQS